MALVNGRSKLAEILAEEGRWRRSPATAHQDSLAETDRCAQFRQKIENFEEGFFRPPWNWILIIFHPKSISN